MLQFLVLACCNDEFWWKWNSGKLKCSGLVHCGHGGNRHNQVFAFDGNTWSGTGCTWATHPERHANAHFQDIHEGAEPISTLSLTISINLTQRPDRSLSVIVCHGMVRFCGAMLLLHSSRVRAWDIFRECWSDGFDDSRTNASTFRVFGNDRKSLSLIINQPERVRLSLLHKRHGRYLFFHQLVGLRVALLLPCLSSLVMVGEQ